MDEDLTLAAYRQSQETKEESTRCLLAAFAYLGIPESLIDLGCGEGHLVLLSALLGIRAYGCDINAPSAGAIHYECRYDHQQFLADVVRADLTRPHDPGRQFDMILCWEVAEHLPPEAADTLCDTAASVLAPGGHLLWSAARPGQPGAGHINCQPASYWRNKLTDRGLSYLPGISKTLRNVMGEVAPKAWWYGANMCVFRKP